ncbi:hypothetical protein E3N88_18604 [Mikania micrantha]|uniref:Uncharacterized protein n=1 Tax=Mikania micrantha TaxID=192012 RepID=A0A5N6NNM0_9ASTR|nr:hypothetical protein E3N88_18604 [Mikania micrantha]
MANITPLGLPHTYGPITNAFGPSKLELGRREGRLPFWAANPLGFSLRWVRDQKHQKGSVGHATNHAGFVVHSQLMHGDKGSFPMIQHEGFVGDAHAHEGSTERHVMVREEFVESFAWTPRMSKSVEK